MLKKAMTIEKGVEIEVATEHLYRIKAKLRKLKNGIDDISPNLIHEMREFNIEIIATVNSLASKTINEIHDIRVSFEERYDNFVKLVGNNHE